ncbi:hypothetical protein Hdeb2414_s0027g00690051 [Helianthus debilis subsp. tardiflorus]
MHKSIKNKCMHKDFNKINKNKLNILLNILAHFSSIWHNSVSLLSLSLSLNPYHHH